jgi:hypothetical protein
MVDLEMARVKPRSEAGLLGRLTGTDDRRVQLSWVGLGYTVPAGKKSGATDGKKVILDPPRPNGRAFSPWLLSTAQRPPHARLARGWSLNALSLLPVANSCRGTALAAIGAPEAFRAGARARHRPVARCMRIRCRRRR